MGICEILTIIFVIAKICGALTWSWFFVLLPEIIAFVIYAVLIIWQIHTARKISKAIDNF